MRDITLQEETSTVARRCPACDSAAGSNQGERNGFQMLSCQNCETLYVVHLPDSENAEDYDSYYTSENLTTPDFIDRRLDEIIAEFSVHRQNNRLLDVGFGAGTLLQAAGRAGWVVSGTEVSRTAVEHVRQLGFDAFHGELGEAQYPTDHFDVVTASEILEHLPNPQALVREIARVLRPGGLFWATTPHGGGVSRKLLGLKWSTVSPPEHLQLFSISGMKTLLNAAGFRRLQIVTESVNPYEILELFQQSKGRAAGEVAASRVEASEASFDRVRTGYQLNESLSKSSSRRAVKNLGNGLLRLSRLGDSLKIRAVN